ncbi:4487_t:CDS:1, partial [Cetraspora pellucida]
IYTSQFIEYTSSHQLYKSIESKMPIKLHTSIEIKNEYEETDANKYVSRQEYEDIFEDMTEQEKQDAITIMN